MSNVNTININEEQLHKLISQISNAIENINGDISIFEFIRMLYFQISVLSIPKEKFSRDLLKNFIKYLLFFNSDTEDIKDAYRSINYRGMHKLLTVEEFSLIVNEVDLSDSSVEIQESKLYENYNSLLTLVENLKLQHKEELNNLIEKTNSNLSRINANAEILANEMRDNSKQVIYYKKKYKNKEEQLNNFIQMLKKQNELLNTEKDILACSCESYKIENKFMKYAIIVLCSTICFNLLYIMLLNRRIKKCKKELKNYLK